MVSEQAGVGHVVTWEERSQEHAKTIWAAVNNLRKTRGLTVAELAAKLTELGWPIGEATLSGMFLQSNPKRKSISVTELFAFATALECSPMYLALGQPFVGDLPETWAPVPAVVRDVSSVLAWSLLESPDDALFWLDTFSRSLNSVLGYNAMLLAKQGIPAAERYASIEAQYSVDNLKTALDNLEEAYELLKLIDSAATPSLPPEILAYFEGGAKSGLPLENLTTRDALLSAVSSLREGRKRFDKRGY